jgi:hypothetical protein
VAPFPSAPRRSGADKGAKNEDEKIALEVAQLNEHAEVVALLE